MGRGLYSIMALQTTLNFDVVEKERWKEMKDYFALSLSLSLSR